MLELVCHPGVRAANARERVKLEAGVNVEVVKVDGRLERHLVCGELRLVVEAAEGAVLHEKVHGIGKRDERGVLAKHPGKHRLAKEHEGSGIL